MQSSVSQQSLDLIGQKLQKLMPAFSAASGVLLTGRARRLCSYKNVLWHSLLAFWSVCILELKIQVAENDRKKIDTGSSVPAPIVGTLVYIFE